jgi:hypothetical protein
MKHNMIVRLSGILAVALLALTASTTLAAGTGGSTWDQAVKLTSVIGQTQSLGAGASEWYAVRYTGGMQDEIDLSTNGVGGVSFAVYSPDAIAAWASTGTLTPTGNGEYNAQEANYDLTWAGHPVPVDGMNYYVQVTNNNATATQFTLNASASPLAQSN